MTRLRNAWIPAVLVGLLAAATSAEVIRCPHHDEADPQWNRGTTGGGPMAGRAFADEAPRLLETDHFAIFYHTSGVHAVAGAAVDLDGNGHPDNVDSIGAIAERVWRLSIDTLEYLKPIPYDTTLGYKAVVPAGKFPIEVADMATFVSSWGGKRYMGFADRPTADKSGRNRQSLVIENDFVDSKLGQPIQVKVDPINTNGTDSLLIDYTKDPVKGWKVAISHEFYHSLQYRYDASIPNGFGEMAAVWYATRCFPEVKHHWQYYPSFVKNIYISAFATHEDLSYRNFFFITALTAALGDGIVKDLWSVRDTSNSGSGGVWMIQAFDSLKIDPSVFTKRYVSEALKMIVNCPSIFNENGAIQVRSVIEVIGLMRGSSAFAGANMYGLSIYKLHGDQLNDGWNLAFYPTSTFSSGAFLRMPSCEVTGIHEDRDTVVVGSRLGDTAWYTSTINVPHNGYSYSVGIGITQKPITSARRRAIGLRPAPQYRVDLQGRPVRAGTRGIILEGAPSTGWTRAVKMGE